MSELRRLSKAGIAFLIGFEAIRLTPYQDGAGVWTDGIGNTENVVPGKDITLAKAYADFDRHVDKFSATVRNSLTKPVSQTTFDSYVSLAFNAGQGAWLSSSTLKAHNAGKPMDACLYMMRWVYITNQRTKKKEFSRGLWNRRYQEYNYCIAGVDNAQWSQVSRFRR